MPHIHEKIDFTAEVFVVHGNKVLIRKHDKYNKWLPPGGHIELDESPDRAAIREAKEEVGLDVELVGDFPKFRDEETGFEELMPPRFMNIHNISETHKHISHIYFARSSTDKVIPGGEDRSEEWKWFTKEDLEENKEGLHKSIRFYALKALEELGDKN